MTQLHSDLGRFQGLEAQVPGRRALREEIYAGDLVSTEKRNEAKKLQETLTKKLKDLPTLKTKFGTAENLNNPITPEIATFVSELEASAVKSMELAQELIDLWAKGTPRPTNRQLSEYRDWFDKMRSELEGIQKGMGSAVIDAIVEAWEEIDDKEDE